MLIGIVSDIHANLEALLEVWHSLKDTEKIICCGDIISYGPNPIETLRLVKREEFMCVKGDHEAGILGDLPLGWFNEYAQKAVSWTRNRLSREDKEFIKELPETQTVELDGIKIFFAHGSPNNPITEYVHYPSSMRKYLDKTKADLIILGHTHIPGIWKLEKGIIEYKRNVVLDRPTLINPGSVGQPRDGSPLASFIILNTENKLIMPKRIEYPAEETARKIEQFGLPDWLGKRLLKGI